MLFILNTLKKQPGEPQRPKKYSVAAENPKLELPKHHNLRRTSSLSQLDIKEMPVRNAEKETGSKPPPKSAPKQTAPKSKPKMKHSNSIGEHLNLASNLAGSLLYVEMNNTGEMVIRQGARPSPPQDHQKLEPKGSTGQSTMNKKLAALQNNKKALSTTNLLHRFHMRKAKPEQEEPTAVQPERSSSAELINDGVT